MNLKSLLKDYSIAASNKVACILESKEEKLQSINDEWNYFGFEFLVYNKKTHNVVYTSHSSKDCWAILRAIK